RGMGKERLLRGLSLLARGFDLYQGDPAGQGRTGLSVARVFWGAEVRLLLGARGQDAESWSFTFTDRDGQPRLHGYHLAYLAHFGNKQSDFSVFWQGHHAKTSAFSVVETTDGPCSEDLAP